MNDSWDPCCRYVAQERPRPSDKSLAEGLAPSTEYLLPSTCYLLPTHYSVLCILLQGPDRSCTPAPTTLLVDTCGLLQRAFPAYLPPNSQPTAVLVALWYSRHRPIALLPFLTSISLAHNSQGGRPEVLPRQRLTSSSTRCHSQLCPPSHHVFVEKTAKMNITRHQDPTGNLSSKPSIRCERTARLTMFPADTMY